MAINAFEREYTYLAFCKNIIDPPGEEAKKSRTEFLLKGAQSNIEFVLALKRFITKDNYNAIPLVDDFTSMAYFPVHILMTAQWPVMAFLEITGVYPP